MTTRIVRLAAGFCFVALLLVSQNIPPGIGQGWIPEFNHAARQIDALADAIPADKFAWRPAPGVRSVSEVLMHITLGNYFLLAQAGVKLPPEPKLSSDSEKTITAKSDVIRLLKASQDLVRASYPKVDRQAKLKFFGNDTTADGVLLRLLVHNHEHMGQLIAYARTIGVVPPWSQSGAQ